MTQSHSRDPKIYVKIYDIVENPKIYEIYDIVKNPNIFEKIYGIVKNPKIYASSNLMSAVIEMLQPLRLEAKSASCPVTL